MTTVRFPVQGMTCASCVRRVEKALAAVPGVSAVRVDLTREEATITHQGVGSEVLAQALEAKGYTLVLQDPAQSEARVARRARWRLMWAWALTLPLWAPMVGIPWHLSPWVQGLLAALVAFGCGALFFLQAGRLAWHGEASMDTLVALGATAAFGFGVAQAASGAHHTAFEIAASLVTFLLTGKFLEARAKHRASESLQSLIELAPATALRVTSDGAEENVAVATLHVGDLVRVRPGSVIPVDGRVVSGAADVEEALLTGEPMPVSVSAGAEVLAGAMVHGGSLEIQVRASGEHTWLAQLAAQIREAKTSRAPAQALADRLSAVFVPSILILAGVTFLGWWLYSGSLIIAWRPAVTVLVIACPCALGLATPVALAMALGTAARQGLLVRDSAALERLAVATDLVLDKTGTLTEGKPRVMEIRSLSDIPEVALKRLAATLERDSEHPVARALRAQWNGDLPPVIDFQAHPGGGVSGRIEGRRLRIGNAAFLNLPLGDLPEDCTAVGVAEEGRLLGVFLLADAVRPDLSQVLNGFRARGVRLHLLSGDRPEAVARFAGLHGLEEAKGGVSPSEKAAHVKALQSAGAIVAFVGDGVNDAAALATADAGLSLPGLDATAASAPLNLRREGLRGVEDAHRLAQKLHHIIRQNLAWAFGYNLVLIPLAALGQLERFGGPMLAGAAMGLSSLTVVLNALRLRR